MTEQVIDQSRRRVIGGESLAANEKVYSIFETHTDLIVRGKARKEVEFGHKIFLAESENGLITDYRVLEGNPSDEQHVEAALERHKQIFGTAPEVFAGDRGFQSRRNEEACEKAGVRVVALPQRGGQKTPERKAFERTPDFRNAQRFRAGIEGRISVLFRGRGLKRCRAKGPVHFELFIGLGVLANNLLSIGRLLASREPLRLAA